jgi:hypothetical protein
MGHPDLWRLKENGRALRDAHLSDDEAVAKMGHPVSRGFAYCSLMMG